MIKLTSPNVNVLASLGAVPGLLVVLLAGPGASSPGSAVRVAPDTMAAFLQVTLGCLLASPSCGCAGRPVGRLLKCENGRLMPEKCISEGWVGKALNSLGAPLTAVHSVCSSERDLIAFFGSFSKMP